MGVTIEQLRAYGSRTVTLTASGRTYRGRIVADKIGDRAVNFLFEPSDTPDNHIVITLDDVSAISER